MNRKNGLLLVSVFLAVNLANAHITDTKSTSSIIGINDVSSSTTTHTTGALTAQTTGTAPQARLETAKHLNYDQVAPDQDAVSKPLDEVTAVTSDTERLAWLATASVADNFREDEAASYTTFEKLIAGDARGRDEGKRFVSTHQVFDGTFRRQPVGPLTGRILYCSAGHGWTNDNTSTSLWYSQRPETHGVVEDFGNLDQMNLYADLCFRAGATIVPMRPLGFQHIERVIDNESGQAFFHGKWADSLSTASFGFAGARIPYRFAPASVQESSVARFIPVIPVSDLYPVYCWARTGEDRVTQTYRIIHAGGVDEVDVNHRRVGNGWVYLGSYMFKAGSTGYVEVTNQARNQADVTSGSVVIADAIRFGNGMGDVNRGGGISRYPREEESSRYWVERSMAPVYPPIYDAFTDREDQSNNVGSAPRFAAHMNRETDGAFFDRLFMSFHSNASGGRGVVGLYNSHAVMRPDHQIELAKLTADELNAELTSKNLTFHKPWYVRPTRTDGHINFGEIRRDYLNNEMSATIVEVAYHDNADDAELLRKLSVRRAIAQSAYRATLRYFGEIGNQEVSLLSPPDAPILVSAVESDTHDSAKLTWLPATEDSLSSSAGEIKYRLYSSTDGIVFDGGLDVGPVTNYTVKGLKSETPGYYRLTAVSKGGESLFSQILGVSCSSGPKVLVVQGMKPVDDDAALTKTEDANLGWALRPGGSFVRLVPRLMDNQEQVRAIGDGIDRLNMGFDSCLAKDFLQDMDKMKRYSAVCIMLGRSPVVEDFASTRVLTALHDYVTSDGRILLSGACLAECDAESTETLSRWGEFASTVLQTKFDPVTSVSQVIKSGDRDLTTVTLQIGDRNLRYFDPRPTEVLVPETNGRAVLAYDQKNGVAAVATLKDQLIRTVSIGFPIEELDSREEQGVLMGQILLAMGLDLQPEKSEKPVEKPQDKQVVVEVLDEATTKAK